MHDFEKDFLWLMNNSVFGKTMENTRKHKGIKFGLANKKLVNGRVNLSHKKWFSESLLAIELNKTEGKINKAVHLGLLILDMSKIIYLL